MNRLTVIAGCAALLLGGGGAGYVIGTQALGKDQSAAGTSVPADTTPPASGSVAEMLGITTPDVSSITEATSEGYVQGFTSAVSIINHGREQSLDQASAALDQALDGHEQAFADAGIEREDMASQVQNTMAPSAAMQQEFDALAEDLTMAQNIAQLAIAERDAAKLELATLEESVETLEAQVNSQAAVAESEAEAEKKRLVASLALEQRRVSTLSEALVERGVEADETASLLESVAAPRTSIETLERDIEILTSRYNRAFEQSRAARAQAVEANSDLRATLDELELATTNLTQARQALEDTQADFFELESRRGVLAQEVALLETSVENRRAENAAVDAASEQNALAAAVTSLATSAHSANNSSNSGGGNSASESSRQVNAQIVSLAQKIADLENRLSPLQEDFEEKVQQQATLRANVIAEELAQDLAQTIAMERAEVLADEMFQELSKQLEREETGMVDTISPIREYLYNRLLEAAAENGINPRLVGERLLLSTNTLFPVGGIELSAAGQQELRAFGQDLIQTLAEADEQTDGPEFLIQVNGHADRRPYRTSRFGNWELSTLRAVSVIEFLVDEVGLPADRLVAAGYAEHQPLVNGDNEDDFALNRRIEFRLVAR